eukprot:Pgem_evm1s3870
MLESKEKLPELKEYLNRSLLFYKNLHWKSPEQHNKNELFYKFEDRNLDLENYINNKNSNVHSELERNSSNDNNITNTNNKNHKSNKDCNKNSNNNINYAKNGFYQFDDNTWTIACTTPLPNCTGKMFYWWFCVCDNSEKYKIWHPYDHISGHWSDDYYGTVNMSER